jgi:AraC-like DNA-binding protein
MDAQPRVDAIVALLRQAGEAMGLNLSFHDLLHRARKVPVSWRQHRAAYCVRRKAIAEPECAAFDGTEVRGVLRGLPAGRIHECPFGVTELAVPVAERGLMVAVLFAGPIWQRRTRPPAPGMVVRPGRAWLENRLVLLRGVARLLGELLVRDDEAGSGERRLAITRYIQEHMAEPVHLSALSHHLSLSPSRARHAVREIFDQSFSELVRSFKLQEAAHLLRTTALPIGEVAARVGFEDQSHFTRVFGRHLRQTPRAYRREHRDKAWEG